jgi:hypothetical protein
MAMKAGGGNVILNANGISLLGSTGFDTNRSYNFTNATYGIYSYLSARVSVPLSLTNAVFSLGPITDLDSQLSLTSQAGAGRQALAILQAGVNGGLTGYLKIDVSGSVAQAEFNGITDVYLPVGTLTLGKQIAQSEISAPATPASGTLAWYPDTTQSWGYFKNDAGKAVPVGQGKLFLDPADGIDSGTSIVTLASNFRVVQFADGGDAFRHYHFFLPPGWAGRTLTVRIMWAPTSTSTGNCRWQVLTKRFAPGTTIDSATTTLTNIDSAGSGVVDRPNGTTPSTTMSLSAYAEGDAMEFRVGRLGTDGSDTFTGAANLLAIELSVVG